jgi:hypothetical protein
MATIERFFVPLSDHLLAGALEELKRLAIKVLAGRRPCA